MTMPASLIRLCPDCGSGDVRWCNVSVRPYCAECDLWAPSNHGTAEDAAQKWNAHLRQVRGDDIAALTPTEPGSHVDAVEEARGIVAAAFVALKTEIHRTDALPNREATLRLLADIAADAHSRLEATHAAQLAAARAEARTEAFDEVLAEIEELMPADRKRHHPDDTSNYDIGNALEGVQDCIRALKKGE